MKYGKHIQQVLFMYSGVIFIASLFNVTLYTYFWTIYAVLFIGIVISAYYHRFLTHYSWNCPRWLEVILAIMTAGHGLTPAISWVAVHRKHHRMSDTPEDPHGPHKGFIKNALVSFYQTDLKYATNKLLNDDLYKFQLKYYAVIAIVYYCVWAYFFGPVSWLIINGFAYIGQVTINYIAHDKGKPVNRPQFALLLSAETYHLNHHKFPTEPRFGKYDIPFMFIRTVDPQSAQDIPQWSNKDDLTK